MGIGASSQRELALRPDAWSSTLDVVEVPPALRAGVRVGPYELVSPLGSGAWERARKRGRVWHDRALGRRRPTDTIPAATIDEVRLTGGVRD